MRINRAALLKMLEAVQSGLSKREIVEQSSCFVFKRGKIYTYNDEVSCCYDDSGLNFTGAVRAEPLLAVLNRLPEEELDIDTNDDVTELIIKGKKREAAIQMDAEITLPLKNVEKPGEWSDLSEGFSEAVDKVAECASDDESSFTLSCVNITPKWIEACDNIQAARYRMATGIEESFLVKASSLKTLVQLGMTKISQTDTWVHFKNAVGLRVSCRRYMETYLKLSGMLKTKGIKATLPKGLVEAADIAKIFSSENPDRNLLEVQMKPGRITVTGRGSSGRYTESKKLPGYDGDKIKFLISPALLMAFSKKHHECEISENFLKVELGSYTYVSCLGSEDDFVESEPKQTEDEE